MACENHATRLADPEEAVIHRLLAAHGSKKSWVVTLRESNGPATTIDQIDAEHFRDPEYRLGVRVGTSIHNIGSIAFKSWTPTTGTLVLNAYQKVAWAANICVAGDAPSIWFLPIHLSHRPDTPACADLYVMTKPLGTAAGVGPIVGLLGTVSFSIYKLDPLRSACAPVAPAVEPAVEPAAEPAAESAAESAAEPAAEPAAESAAEPAAESGAEPAAEPESAAESGAEPESAAESGAEPAAEPAAESGAESAAESDAEPAAEPPAEPVDDIENLLTHVVNNIDDLYVDGPAFATLVTTLGEYTSSAPLRDAVAKLEKASHPHLAAQLVIFANAVPSYTTLATLWKMREFGVLGRIAKDTGYPAIANAAGMLLKIRQ